jgi:hypothetical protein
MPSAARTASRLSVGGVSTPLITMVSLSRGMPSARAWAYSSAETQIRRSVKERASSASMEP